MQRSLASPRWTSTSRGGDRRHTVWGQGQHRPSLLIFGHLDKPEYAVWDGDYGRSDTDAESEARKNRVYLRLLGLPEEDWPDFVGEKGACFRTNLGATPSLTITCLRPQNRDTLIYGALYASLPATN